MEQATNPDKGKKHKTQQGRKAARRAKGTGTLERHGRTWRAVWTVDGKTFRRSTGTPKITEAREKLKEFIAPYRLRLDARKDAKAARVAGGEGFVATAKALEEAARGKRVEAGRKAVPLSKAWELFNSSPRRNPVVPGLNKTYETRFGAFLTWAKENRPGMNGLADVDAEAVDAFMRDLRPKVSPKTYNDYRSLFAQMWTILDVDAGLDGANPWKEIKPLPKETHVRRELTAEELQRVVGPLEGEMRILFAIGIYTGLRLGDAVNLSWGAVDLVRGFIQWIPRKTAKHGTVVRIPLFPALAAILAETPERKRQGLILPKLAEEYGRSRRYTSERVQRVFAKAGIETQGDTGRSNPKNKGTTRKAVEVGFHSLRHTFVSLCANAGVPLHLVQAIVGHSQVAMTTHYFHVSDDALRGAVKALPDVFTPAALPVAKGKTGTSIGKAATENAAPPDLLEAVPAKVAKVARMLADCPDAMVAQAEQMLSKWIEKERAK